MTNDNDIVDAAAVAPPNQQRQYGLDQVNVSFLDTSNADNGDASRRTLPLVVSPRWDASSEFLSHFLVVNRPWMNEQILKYGAVLIRGFDVADPVRFEQAVLSLQPDLCDAYRGTSPRSLMPGTTFSFSAADVPVTYPIAQHLEMSFLKSPPRQLYFGCMKASSKPGGETSLCDFRKVYQDLSPELRSKLHSKKIKYTRRHYEYGESYTYDVGAMLGWPQLFGTNSKAEVERIVANEGAPTVKWVGANADTFLQEWVDDPFQVHPDTNEMVWFNHSQVFHWTTFPCELWYAYCRVKDWHLLVHFILLSIYCFIKYGILGHTMALNTTFGDDEPISYKEMSEIRAAIHKNMVFSRWRKGDILCIDNFSTSHGRQPTYDKGRKVIVAWSHPIDKVNSMHQNDPAEAAAIVSADLKRRYHDAKLDREGHFCDNKDIPDLVDASPDVSPESTLDSSEAETLQHALQAQVFNKLLSNGFTEEPQTYMRRPNRYRHRHMKSCPDLLQANSDFWKEAGGVSHKVEKME